MAKVTGKYETIFIADTTLGDDGIAALVAKFKALIEANGTLGEVVEWGKRHLAYPIDHKTEGYYTLITFTSAPEFPAELTRNYNITDGVIRSIVVEQAE
ncbi:MAG: 30S ribosomal protein S6 [Oscillospiraceae bacterium]|nr:30S ribosomal protein S6 [Oscillospiraceae bacterium]